MALHEKFWQDRLLCPGGGEYVWNDQWQTMESTVYGCPGAPKDGPPAPPLLNAIKQGNFGLTFEDQGFAHASNWSDRGECTTGGIFLRSARRQCEGKAALAAASATLVVRVAKH